MTQQLEPTVLVVEDDSDLREVIAETLETDGFTITQASDAAAALMHLRAFAFDAVVIDLRLPDADGMRVLDMALDCYPQIVSVVVSGFGGVTEAVAAMKRGAHDFLIKPFALPQLSKVLKTGLGQRQHRQENAEIRAQLGHHRAQSAHGETVLDFESGRAVEHDRAPPRGNWDRQGARCSDDSREQRSVWPAVRGL